MARHAVMADGANEPATLAELLDQAVREHGPRPALLCRPRYRTEVWTYRHLGCRARAVATWLSGRGVQPGDRVVLWGPNSPGWVAALIGVLRLGAVAVPLDVRSGEDFVQGVLRQAEPKRLLVSARLPEAGRDWGVPTTSLEDLDRLPAVGGSARPQSACGPAPDDLAEIVFTSGTTGDPKGVMLTHRNIAANVAAARSVFPTPPDFRLLSLLPLSHMFEQTVGLFLPLSCGASVFYPASRQSTTIFRELRDQGISQILLVPQALQLFMQAIEREVRQRGQARAWQVLQPIAALLPMAARRGLFRAIHQRLGGRLQYLITGGAAIEPDLIRRWELLGIPVLQGYGLSEASPVITGMTLADRNATSVGRPLPGVEVRIAPDGEVLARGASISPGYWRNPAATAEAFEAGWLRTGDLGRLDERGWLHLLGRKKDRIVLPNGQNVYPEDVERALRTVPGVTDAAVVGRPRLEGTRHGVEVHAVLLTADGADPAAVVRQANARLAAHQQIQGYTVWPEPDFPRTHTLKVRKRAVLDRVLALRANGPTDPSAAIEPPTSAAPAGTAGADPLARLHRLMAEAAGVPIEQITAGAALGTDLGLDSLGRVELLAAIEGELGLYLDEATVGPATTVGELQAQILGQARGARPELPTWPVAGPAAALRPLLQAPALAAARLIAPAQVEGTEHLAALKPPVLFVANHTSHLDTPTVLRALPARFRRRTAVAAAADYFFTGHALGPALALVFNAFPFSRTTAIRPTLEHCAWLLDRGWSILLYPEGTRSTTGELAPFKSGVGLLAVELGASVVPIHTDGLVRVLPKGATVPRPGRARVRIGPPLKFAADTPYDAAAARIEAAVRALDGRTADQLKRGGS